MAIIRTKKQSIEIFKTLEDKCKASPLLIKQIDTDENISINSKDYKEFILDFITRINNYSIYTSTEEGKDFTEGERKRSLGDLYRIIISYFPDTDIVELAKFLTEQSENLVLKTNTCPDIKKIIFTKVHHLGERQTKMSNKYAYYRDFGNDDTHQYHTEDNLYPDDYLILLD